MRAHHVTAKIYELRGLIVKEPKSHQRVHLLDSVWYMWGAPVAQHTANGAPKQLAEWSTLMACV